jgi:hypothetical protein
MIVSVARPRTVSSAGTEEKAIDEPSLQSKASIPVYCRAGLRYVGDLLVQTDIRNGRMVDLPGWEVCGFELMTLPTAVTDFADIGWHGVYAEEIERLVRQLTSCDAVVFYPPLLRSPEAAAASPDLAPIEFVHSDYTEAYRSMIGDTNHPYHRILEPSMARAGVTAADVRSARRVLTLQVWRNVGVRHMDRPLCFCDARTVPRSRLQPIRVAEYGGLVTEFDAFAVEAPRRDEYAWYTFPAMTLEEVVVFRAFDSECMARGEAFWTPHTAFRDPNAPPAAPGRQSVEARAICLFLS